MMRTSLKIRVAGALLVLLAAGIHFYVAPEHFEETWKFGWFMVIVGLLQLADAALLALWPARPVLTATILGNLAVVAIFVWAYTLGLPLGPDAGMAEMLTGIALAATVAEAVVALLAVLQLAIAGEPRRPVRQPIHY